MNFIDNLINKQFEKYLSEDLSFDRFAAAASFNISLEHFNLISLFDEKIDNNLFLKPIYYNYVSVLLKYHIIKSKSVLDDKIKLIFDNLNSKLYRNFFFLSKELYNEKYYLFINLLYHDELEYGIENFYLIDKDLIDKEYFKDMYFNALL